MSADAARTKQVFLDALELQGAARAAFLDETCGGDADLRAAVERLLAAHESADRVLGPDAVTRETPVALAAAASDTDPSTLGLAVGPGDEVGDYRLEEAIGEGGFGVVFRAEQLRPVRRRVALKIVRLGQDSQQVVARFEAERQALALMDHPHIAQVFDAGTTPGGRPYFVMEFVDGAPLTRFCADAGLSLRERLELFRDVCRAVHHAHTKGVIHRDLKPGNVLVAQVDGRPVPKVIDFGVAKAIDEPLHEEAAVTLHGQAVGTPAYMSPEQASGRTDVDTRADVYALGVLLYELVTGTQPFDASGGLVELQRQILRVDPPRPSQRRRERSGVRTPAGDTTSLSSLPADLDWITLRALEKDPARRYPSAFALAADVQRLLDHEPVEAAPPSAAYRLRKFVRRHRVAVAVVAVAFLGLVGTAIGTSLGLVRARDAEAEALTEADRAQRAANFMAETLGSVDAEEFGRRMVEEFDRRVRDGVRARGGTEQEASEASAAFRAQLAMTSPTDAARHLLDSELLAPASAAVDVRFANDPVLAATLKHTLGRTYDQLGLLEQAEAEHLSELALLEEHRPGQPEVFRALGGLGIVYEDQGRGADAVEVTTRAYEGLLGLFGPEDEQTLMAKKNAALALRHTGRLDEAQRMLEECIEANTRIFGPDHAETLRVRSGLVNILRSRTDHVQAEALARELLEDAIVALGPDDEHTLVIRTNLGAVLADLGRHREAEALWTDLLERTRRLHGDEHPSTTRIMNNLATAKRRLGKHEEARELAERTLAIQLVTIGEDHPLTLVSFYTLGNAVAGQGDLDHAADLLRRAAEGMERVQGPEYRDTLTMRNSYAMNELRRGNFDTAEGIWNELIETQSRVLGPHHGDTLATLNNLAVLYSMSGDWARSEATFRRKLQGSLEQLGPTHARTHGTWFNLACLAAIQGRPEEAFDWLQEAVDHGYDRADKLAAETDFDTLRDDPRFTAIVEAARGNAARVEE